MQIKISFAVAYDFNQLLHAVCSPPHRFWPLPRDLPYCGEGGVPRPAPSHRFLALPLPAPSRPVKKIASPSIPGMYYIHVHHFCNIDNQGGINCGVGSPRKFFIFHFSLQIMQACNDSSGSGSLLLWLCPTLALSLSLSDSLWLTLALSGANRLTRSLLGSQCWRVANGSSLSRPVESVFWTQEGT